MKYQKPYIKIEYILDASNINKAPATQKNKVKNNINLFKYLIDANFS